MMRTKTRKPRFPCLTCKKKYCSQENTLCKKCELQVRIDSLDLEVERQRIIDHYEEHHASKHSHGKFVGEMNKPKYKLFIMTRNAGKSGRETWFFRGDVGLGYPRWGKTSKKVKGQGYVWVDCIDLHTYGYRYFQPDGFGWKYFPIGETGKFMVGPCIIRGDAVQWLEPPYEKQIKEGWEQKKRRAIEVEKAAT